MGEPVIYTHLTAVSEERALQAIEGLVGAVAQSEMGADARSEAMARRSAPST